MKAFEQAISAIRQIDDHQEIREVIEAIKLQQTYIGRQTIRKLATGDHVSFNGRNGHTKGVVKKINRKYVLVDTATGQWRVPATMLTKEEAYA